MLDTSDSNVGKIIKTAPNKFIKFLCKCLLNIVNGNVPVNKTKLEGYEKSFQTLLSNQTSFKLKRKLLAKETVGENCWIFLLSILDKRIMHTEEFILIPKRMFLSHQPVKNETLENPNYEQKAAQLSLFQRNQSEKPKKKKSLLKL